ncbi:MAG: hypothetical protein GX621_13695 [Pirellulaceae bacterium]|nr:hypothetical protein [Pirellulaceae bacterium]
MAVGGLCLLVDEVSPLDRWAVFIGPTIIGVIAGVTVSICLGVVGGIRIIAGGCHRGHEDGDGMEPRSDDA